MTKFKLGIKKDSNGALKYVVANIAEGKTEFADATRSAEMLLKKAEAVMKMQSPVVSTRAERKATNGFIKATGKQEVQKLMAQQRAKQINSGSGHKCANPNCRCEISVRVADFIKKNGRKVPKNHPYYNKWVCVKCQRAMGLDKLMMKK